MKEIREAKSYEIGRVARYLRTRSQPRLMFIAVLAVAGVVGASVSFVMLRSGINRMSIRYPIAAIVAYMTFLFLLRVWRDFQLKQPNITTEIHNVEKEHNDAAATNSSHDENTIKGERRDIFDGIDLINILDIDEGGLGILIGVLISIIFLVFTTVGLILSMAPDLLAEILLDGLLMTGMWNRFRKIEAENPLGVAFRITWLPALIVIIAIAGLGFLFEYADPTARSIGDVFR